ncbi:MAG: hypothetical protein WBA25_03450 [Jannaschia sp.]
MKMVIYAVAFAGSMSSIADAQDAKCFHNGVEHDEGATVGEMVCRDGRWVQQ